MKETLWYNHVIKDNDKSQIWKLECHIHRKSEGSSDNGDSPWSDRFIIERIDYE